MPSPKNHRIYFDYGDKTLNALYWPYQQQVDGIMKAKGYKAKSEETRVYPGADHSENSWRKRLDVPLSFLLAK